MSDIKLRVVLNKGGHGILMQKLAKIAEEAEKFLAFFSEDLNLSPHEWVADNFKNGSVSFTANYVGVGEEQQVFRARKVLSRVIDPKTKVAELNGDLRPRTYTQFAKIAHPIDADDSIGLGVPNDKGRFVTKAFTKARANIIEREMNRVVEEFAGFQGSITALFKEGTCWLKDAVSGNRIVCEYKPHQYNAIWKLLEDRDGIADIEGWLVTINGMIDVLKIERIDASPEYREGDIDKFFGSSPSFTGELSTEDYLDELRNEQAD